MRISKEFPSGVIQTKLGEVGFRINGATTVHLNTGKNPITVHGVGYTATLNLFLIDGTWQKDPKDWHEPYLNRTPWVAGKEPSEAAKRAVREAFTAAWVEWINANPLILQAAEEIRLNNEVARLEAKGRELAKQLDELSEEALLVWIQERAIPHNADPDAPQIPIPR